MDSIHRIPFCGDACFQIEFIQGGQKREREEDPDPKTLADQLTALYNLNMSDNENIQLTIADIMDKILSSFKTSENPIALYDEFQQVGVDFNKISNKDGYFLVHLVVRDFDYRYNYKILFSHMSVDPQIDWNKESTSDDRYTPLHYASSLNSTLQTLLKLPQIDINHQSHYGTTKLHDACKNFMTGDITILLKDSRINVNLKNKFFENTPLHLFLSTTRNVSWSGWNDNKKYFFNVLDDFLANSTVDWTVRDNYNHGTIHYIYFEYPAHIGKLSKPERLAISNEIFKHILKRATQSDLLEDVYEDAKLKKGLSIAPRVKWFPIKLDLYETVQGVNVAHFAAKADDAEMIRLIYAYNNAFMFSRPNPRGHTPFDLATDMTCKLLLKTYMIRQTFKNILPMEAARVTAAREIRNALCEEVFSDANKRKLLDFAAAMGMPEQWRISMSNNSQADICKILSTVIAIGAVWDPVKFIEWNEKQKKLHMLENFRNQVKMIFGIDVDTRETLDNLMKRLDIVIENNGRQLRKELDQAEADTMPMDVDSEGN